MMGMQRPGPMPVTEQDMFAAMGQAGGALPVNMRMAHAQVTLSEHRGAPHSNPSHSQRLTSLAVDSQGVEAMVANMQNAAPVGEVNMRMGQAQGVEAFMPNMQHAERVTEYLPRMGAANSVEELNMKMGQAQGVDAFVANMQHAQVTVADGQFII